MQVQQHVVSAVANVVAGMSHQIVEQFGGILGVFVGGLVFMGSDFANGQKNCRINGEAIVEGGANYFLNVIYSGSVEGLGEVWGRH